MFTGYDPFTDRLTTLVRIYNIKEVVGDAIIAANVLFYIRSNSNSPQVAAINNYLYNALGEKKYFAYLKILEDFNEETKKFKTIYYLTSDAEMFQVFDICDVWNFIYYNINQLQALALAKY